MNVLIIPNLEKENAVVCVQKTCAFLAGAGVSVYMDQSYQTGLENVAGIHFGETEQIVTLCDFIISIGGDGTILHSSKTAVKHSKPILGINAGRLGFLAALEANEIDLLQKLIRGQYVLEKRMMLYAEHKTPVSINKYLALNDVVVSTGALSKMIELDVFCNDKYVISYRSDGVIFSTPTGSTAYTLSAGGPIIEPTIDCISMTPICPQTLYNRSMIFNGASALKVKLPDTKQENVYITVDGEVGIQMDSMDELSIYKSDTYVNFIDLQVNDFYEVINRKFLGRSQ